MSSPTDLWADVVGQDDAVAQLRLAAASPVHAYLLVGPHGSGKRVAATRFGAEVLAHGHDGDDAERHRRLAAAERHPDLVVVEPEGRTLRVEEAERLIHEGSRTPVEGDRKVIVCDRFHTAEPAAAASLLKTIEEPPIGTVFVLLAEEVPPEHVTIASRCVTVAFGAVAPVVVSEWLIGQGVDSEVATRAAEAAAGDLDRARLLVTDSGLAERHEAWRAVPDRLDGTGATVAVVVDELRGLIDGAQGPLEHRHADELEALAEREEMLGTRGSGRSALEARHKREARRLRDAEIRFGLATLAGRYRDRLVDGGDRAHAEALDHLRSATDSLDRNANEALLLMDLFLRLPPFSRDR